MANEIKSYGERENARNTRKEAAFGNLVGDLKKLNDTIEKLQNTPGAITPEDQALLSSIEAQSDAFTAKIEALAGETPDVPEPQ